MPVAVDSEAKIYPPNSRASSKCPDMVSSHIALTVCLPQLPLKLNADLKSKIHLRGPPVDKAHKIFKVELTQLYFISRDRCFG